MFQPLNFIDHPLHFVRQPNIVLITKGEVISVAYLHQAREVLQRAQVAAIVGHHPDFIRVCGRPAGEDFRGLVAGMVVPRNDDEITIGLGEQRADQFVEVFLAVVGREQNRDAPSAFSPVSDWSWSIP